MYDLTNNGTYLDAAKDIFEDLLTGLGATCGGQWFATYDLSSVHKVR